MTKTAVVALGGNALTREGQAGTSQELTENATEMARSVHALRRAAWRVVLVHGNGPQIGNLAIQHDEGQPFVPAQPLYSLGAMSQGQIGSLLTLALHSTAGAERVEIASVVTHVVVSADDPAFANPTKPIGPFFTPEQAVELAEARGWQIAEDSGRGYRRVVASPLPQSFLEAASVEALIERGALVIAAGGGGVPVVLDEAGHPTGLEAVVDKDYAAGRLATSLDVDALVMVTGVEQVMLDFGTPGQRPLVEVTDDELERHLNDGQFPEGSMGPKVRAAIQFLRSGGRQAVITTPELAAATLSRAPGSEVGGTVIRRSRNHLEVSA